MNGPQPISLGDIRHWHEGEFRPFAVEYLLEADGIYLSLAYAKIQQDQKKASRSKRK